MFRMLWLCACMVPLFAFQPKTPEGYVPMPSSDHYPVAAEEIARWAQTQDVNAIREHGWYLFHDITQPVKADWYNIPYLPLWQTWYSVTQAFTHEDDRNKTPAYLTLTNASSDAYVGPTTLHGINEGSAPILNRNNGKAPEPGSAAALIDSDPDKAWDPSVMAIQETQLETFMSAQTPTYSNTTQQGDSCGDGILFANNGDIMIAGEYYDLNAFDHLRGKKLYLQDTLNNLLKEGKTSIPQFPNTAISLKIMHWPIAADQMTAVPVWDNDPARPAYQYNGYETWKRVVAVDSKRASKTIAKGTTTTVKTMYSSDQYPLTMPGYELPRSFTEAKVVGLDQFFHIKITQQLYDALDANDLCILNQSANWAFNRNIKVGDAIALIAIHIDTKEWQPWTFQSFWWHDQPNLGPFAQNRPSDLKQGIWENYLMTTAYSQETPMEYDGSPAVAYNPFVELVIHPIPTNCMNCHARAAYPSSKNQKHPKDQHNFAHYDDTPAGRNEVKPDSAELKGLITTDFLWTIADRAIKSEKKK